MKEQEILNDMEDIETMSLDPHAAIIPIGAVEFDIATQKLVSGLYAVVDLIPSAEASKTGVCISKGKQPL